MPNVKESTADYPLHQYVPLLTAATPQFTNARGRKLNAMEFVHLKSLPRYQ